jgi:hypothetical protein
MIPPVEKFVVATAPIGLRFGKPGEVVSIEGRDERKATSLGKGKHGIPGRAKVSVNELGALLSESPSKGGTVVQQISPNFVERADGKRPSECFVIGGAPVELIQIIGLPRENKGSVFSKMRYLGVDPVLTAVDITVSNVSYCGGCAQLWRKVRRC